MQLKNNILQQHEKLQVGGNLLIYQVNSMIAKKTYIFFAQI